MRGLKEINKGNIKNVYYKVFGCAVTLYTYPNF